MIVKCESCQSRFKIGDEKVTERGVKVRCTKCGSVFTVRKVSAAAAEPEAEPAPSVEAPGGPPAPPADAFSSDPAPLVESIFRQNADVPVVEPGLTPAFGSETTAEGPAATAYGDLPMEWPPPELARPEPPPPPPGALAADPLDMPLDPLGATPPPSRIEEYWSNEPPPAPSSAAAPDLEPSDEDPLAGLNLSRSLDPLDEPQSNGSAPPVLSATDPGQNSGDFSQLDDSSEPLANQVGWEPQPAEEPPPPPAPEPAAKWTQQLEVERPPAEEPPLAVQHGEVEPAGERSVFDNLFRAVASTSLVILAVLAFVLYRNGGRIDLHHAGPSFSGALGLGHASAAREPYFTAVDSTGYYPTLNGFSLAFVTGRATNAGPHPVPLTVHLEIDDGSGRILTRADGLSGVLATPEDLYAVRDPSNLEALQHRLSNTTPPPLQPGQSLPFTLVMASPSVPLDGTLLRVSASPWVPPPPRPAPPTPSQPDP